MRTPNSGSVTTIEGLGKDIPRMDLSRRCALAPDPVRLLTYREPGARHGGYSSARSRGREVINVADHQAVIQDPDRAIRICLVLLCHIEQCPRTIFSNSTVQDVKLVSVERAHSYFVDKYFTGAFEIVYQFIFEEPQAAADLCKHPIKFCSILIYECMHHHMEPLISGAVLPFCRIVSKEQLSIFWSTDPFETAVKRVHQCLRAYIRPAQ